MKKILILSLLAISAFSYNKVIGYVKINGIGMFDSSATLNVYCINGVKYIGSISSKYKSSLSPLYNKSGKIEICK